MIGHVSPEAMIGGPISLVQNNDNIGIDLIKGKIDLNIPEEEWYERKMKWKPKKNAYIKGALAKYSSLVASASEGLSHFH